MFGYITVASEVMTVFSALGLGGIVQCTFFILHGRTMVTSEFGFSQDLRKSPVKSDWLTNQSEDNGENHQRPSQAPNKQLCKDLNIEICDFVIIFLGNTQV
jgi:hypothetical protein